MSATSAIPQTGRGRAADPCGLDLRAAAGRRVGRVRLLAQRQSDAQEPRNDAGLAGGRLRRAGVFLRHGGHALRHDAARTRAITSSPARTSTAAPIGCCTRSSNRPGIECHAGASDRSGRAANGASRRNTKLALDRKPGNPLMSITDIAGLCRGGASSTACCWASTTRSPRPC